MNRRSLGALMAFGLFAAVTISTSGRASAMSFTLKSSSFASQGEIPMVHTCEGNDVSPALTWSGEPLGTKSFALIVDDPDAPDPKAPKRTFVHWVLYNLPLTTHSLGEGASGQGQLPTPGMQGKNDWNNTSYGGPCPPIGRHRYFFKLYALDTTLSIPNATKADLEKAMDGHILGKVELVGTYEKKKR